MRIAYIIEEPQLCGGVKVVFQHARLLMVAGHSVTVFGRGAFPEWANFWGDYVDYVSGSLSEHVPYRFDLVVATYYPTIERALFADIGPVVHFCQGYEGSLEHLQPFLKEIERAYSYPIPSFVVSPHLGHFLERRFGRECMIVPPAKDSCFVPWLRLAPHRQPTIVVPGIFEAACKGVEPALKAVCALKKKFPGLRLVRLSTVSVSDEEMRILPADSFLCGVSAARVAQALRRADLMIFPSTDAEGFGLPLLESMSCKLPAVASRIPSVEYMTGGVLPMVKSGDVEAFAWEAERLLVDSERWLAVRRMGFSQSMRFHPRHVAVYLQRALEWVRCNAKVG